MREICTNAHTFGQFRYLFIIIIIIIIIIGGGANFVLKFDTSRLYHSRMKKLVRCRHTCEELVQIFIRCEKLVPIFHIYNGTKSSHVMNRYKIIPFEQLVPNPFTYEESVLNSQTFEKSRQNHHICEEFVSNHHTNETSRPNHHTCEQVAQRATIAHLRARKYFKLVLK